MLDTAKILDIISKATARAQDFYEPGDDLELKIKQHFLIEVAMELGIKLVVRDGYLQEV